MAQRSLVQLVHDLALPTDQTRAPVFVVGAARSGTSVLAWALAEHDAFATSYEADFIVNLYGFGRLQRAYSKARSRSDGWLQRNAVELPEFCQHLGDGLDGLYRSRVSGDRWIDATPRHSLMTLELALLFPSARFIHIIRNGRDAVNSMIHSGFEAWSARSFTLACMNWARYVRGCRRLTAASPGRVLELRYENLVASPAQTWASIFDFLDAKHSDGPARFVETNRINSSFGHRVDEDGRESEAPEKPPEWTPLQRRIFAASAGSLMRELGYPSLQE